jgi:hypothetical protein
MRWYLSTASAWPGSAVVIESNVTQFVLKNAKVVDRALARRTDGCLSRSPRPRRRAVSAAT